MAALGAATVTVLNTYQGGRLMRAFKRRGNLVNVIFGDNASTYPSGGIVLPAFGAFGMVRFLEYLQFIDNVSGDGYVYKYDVANKKIRIYTGAASASLPLVEVSTSFVPANNVTLISLAVGW
jgi:hypothetical protein